MSVHLNAKKEDVASTVLLPGDPLRAQYIAHTFLDQATRYNEVRGMYGFTGTYKGEKISVQGTGMGQPSAAIYINELIQFYGVHTLIRIGSCGSLQEDVKIRDLVVAMSASTDSHMNTKRFQGHDFAATADSELLFSVHEAAKHKNLHAHFGNIVSTDTFYSDDEDEWKMWARYGVLAIEMETSQLYTLAAKHKVRALSILTVSDSLVTQEQTTSEEREKTFSDMVHLALETVKK